MRVGIRILSQLALILAVCAAFAISEGGGQAWLILFVPMAVTLPGILGSLFVLAPLERWLDRRGQGAFVYLAAPAVGAVAALLFVLVLGGHPSNVAAGLPWIMAAGTLWGLLWALTRPLAR